MEEFTWEVTIKELEGDLGTMYKVTRRMPAISVAETRIFYTKELALKQFMSWLK
jgi:hypothetical protein